MRLICVYTNSHRELFTQWFLPTVQDDFEIIPHLFPVQGLGTYLDPDWSTAVEFKLKTIITAIENNWGESFIYSDVDIQFFSPIKTNILRAIETKDIVCQKDNPQGLLCTGFIVMRGNPHTLNLFKETLRETKKEGRDQLAFNRILRTKKNIRFGYLPNSFFGGGTFSGRLWSPGMPLRIPRHPIMHHANYTIGIPNKIAQLEYVRKSVYAQKARFSNLWNQLRMFTSGKNQNPA